MVKSKFYNLDTDTNLGGEESSDLYVASEKAVKAYVDAHAHAADNKSITENSLNQLQTVGVIDSNDSTRAIKTWTGTKAQYDSLGQSSWSTPTYNSNLTYRIWTAMAYGNNKFVAIGERGDISTSTDGTTWAAYSHNTNLGEHDWYGLAYDGSKFVAVSWGGYISTSTDGNTWTEATYVENLGNCQGCHTLIYDGSKFIVIGQAGYVSTSTNGTTWTEAIDVENLESYLTWICLAYGNNKYVVLANDGHVSTSMDGITWTEAIDVENLHNYTWLLFYDGEKFVAINSEGHISTSIDGTTWTVPVADDVLSTVSQLWAGYAYDGLKSVILSDEGYLSTLQSNTGSLDSNTLYNITSGGLYLGINKISDVSNDATITITQGGISKGTFTTNASENVTIDLDAGGGSSYTAGTGIDITSGIISVTTPTLTNIATGSNSLTVGGINFNGPSSVNVGISSKASNGSTAVGYNAQAMAQSSITIGQSANVASTASNSIAIGANTSCTGNTSIAIGINASTTATRAIQLGYGTNSEANSFYVSTSTSNNWKMLGSDGFIPDARLSSNIARTSAIPTVDQTYSASSTNAQSGTAVAQALASNYAMVITDYTAA